MSAASLAVEDVSWAPRRDRTPILHPTSFALNAGDVLGIVGANGAGKSTLLRLLYRYHKPLTGRIRVGVDDIWALAPRAVARRIAAVLQEQPTDFALTVRDIVSLGRTPHRGGWAVSGKRDQTIVEEALTRLDLGGFAHRQLGTLSGGERQRVMVARALAQEPQVLVLDEPTNHLDIRHQLEMVALIRSLDLTIVTALHDLNMAAGVCDKILLLRHGQMTGFGPPATVLSETTVSTAFNVAARRERLSLSQDDHLTFHLPH
ncbi:ABC transporter ATP-binding protein [Aestuariibius sp. 2305UL40-4]|uniref:ABC transporter ATP-binding protein n=1 Tax=Aestuariibius violaceus TaxID=3234132 RepID=UPI00345E6C60